MCCWKIWAGPARGAHICAEVVGYGPTAMPITSPPWLPGGAGAADCMRLALADGGVQPQQVDYINAHGTGTPAERHL